MLAGVLNVKQSGIDGSTFRTRTVGQQYCRRCRKIGNLDEIDEDRQICKKC